MGQIEDKIRHRYELIKEYTDDNDAGRPDAYDNGYLKAYKEVLDLIEALDI